MAWRLGLMKTPHLSTCMHASWPLPQNVGFVFCMQVAEQRATELQTRNEALAAEVRRLRLCWLTFPVCSFMLITLLPRILDLSCLYFFTSSLL